MMGTRALVTGGFGFSGSFVVRQLLSEGHDVVATDLPGVLESSVFRARVATIGLDINHPRLTLVPADLLRPKTLSPLSAFCFKHVFHTASLYDYSASLERLDELNVNATRNLADAMTTQASLERFVHWSTCGVYGKPIPASRGPRVNIPFSENSSSPKNSDPDARGPEGTKLVNDYSISKWRQEKLLWRIWAERRLPLTVIRPAPIYGPGSSYGHGGVILCVANGLFPILPRDARNFVNASVHVEDVARFATHIVRVDNSLGEDYNVADNGVVSFYEFLRYIALLSGRRMMDLPIVRLSWVKALFQVVSPVWLLLERRFGVRRVQVFEVQSVRYVNSSYWISNRKSLDTGFIYKYSDVKEGLKDTIQWLQENGWLTDKSKLFERQRVRTDVTKETLTRRA